MSVQSLGGVDTPDHRDWPPATSAGAWPGRVPEGTPAEWAIRRTTHPSGPNERAPGSGSRALGSGHCTVRRLLHVVAHAPALEGGALELLADLAHGRHVGHLSATRDRSRAGFVCSL